MVYRPRTALSLYRKDRLRRKQSDQVLSGYYFVEGMEPHRDSQRLQE
jgi:hypothetical protein